MLAAIIGLGLMLTGPATALAQGSLTIELNAPYNLVVDSNVLSPSTYAPELATIGAGFCNYGSDPLTNVTAFIGSYADGTPGIYPSRDSTDGNFQAEHPHLSNSGDYSLTHVGGSAGTADATRFIGDLDVGECSWQYWHFTYPRIENPDNTGADPVWGLTRDPDDDLWLNFDVWATSAEGPVADTTWKVVMRNEISAVANKIYPNTGNWFTDPVNVVPGQTITTTGVNYDMGVINKGFDNDGDLAYDYNAWLQPIGDPSFDPSCFRLVKTSGQITIKRSGGNPDYVYDFEDELYFTDLPSDNAGGYGLVYYTFMALSGPCSVPMSPYQEVASGADNEKFAGDYGITTINIESSAPEVTLGKTVDLAQVAPGGTLSYSMSFANTGTGDAGDPDYGVPLVISDSIPPDTTYVAGSTGYSLSFSPNNGVKIVYSTDNGVTWTTTEPAASSVTDIQWWLQDAFPAGESGTASFQVTVDNPYSGDPVVENTAYAGFGASSPFAEDTVGTLVNGTNSIGDYVWNDANYDGNQAGESGIDNVTVTLYWDRDGDGVLDDDETAVVTTSTSGGGGYLFSNVPDGDFIVVVDTEDPDLTSGYSNTTDTEIAITGLSGGVSNLTADFGFGPSLVADKTLTSADPAYEGETVTYTIDLTNTRPSSVEPCTYTIWAEDYDAGFTSWLDPANATGAAGPDGFESSSNSGGGGNDIRVDTWSLGTQPGTITQVEAVVQIHIDQNLDNDDLDGVIYFDAGGGPTEIQRNTFPETTFNDPSPPGYCCDDEDAHLLEWDVTAARAWTWADFPNVTGSAMIALEFKHSGGTDAANFHVDALGFRVSSSQSCSGQDDDMSLVPLTDTFNADLLDLVSSDIPYDSLTYTGSPYSNTGVITWNDVGPLLAGDTTTITLTFTAKEPPDGDADGEPDPTTHPNGTSSTGATFYDDDPVNDASASDSGTLNPAGTIGDYVFNDNGGTTGTSGNGVQDGDEQGIPFVTVWLYSDPNGDGDPADGALIDTQVTDETGYYLFTSVVEGNYVTVVDTTTLPNGGTGVTQTGDPDEGGTCATCDDRGATTIDYSNGSSADDDDLNQDYGYQVPNTIYGNVWEDNDNDGSWDAGENGLSGITVELDDGTCTLGTDCATATTDANGYYVFDNVPDGTYQVVVDDTTLPAGGTWTQTADPDATLDDQTTTAFSVSGGTIYGAYDFGYNHTASSVIGDTLFADWNGDGTQDAADEGIPNVTIELWEDANGDGVIDPVNDALVATTSTDASGSYTFSGLPAGDFIVKVDENDPDLPPAYVQTYDPDEVGVCTTCSGTGSVTTDGSSTYNDLDFGYQPRGYASIGDYVWKDIDGDGIQDASEVGIAGINVSLYEDTDGNGTYEAGTDALISSQWTKDDGSYLFFNLPAGDYLVDIDTDDPRVPVDDYGNTYVLTSGADPTAVNLSATEAHLNADFGFAPGGVIGDTVFQDDNGDGGQGENEPGIANVTVWLYSDPNGDGDPADGSLLETQVTDSNGNYLFSGLFPDDYVVVLDTADAQLPSTNVTADPDGTYDGVYGVSLSAGQTVRFVDFGVQPPGVIGDAVWIDTDGNGVYDVLTETGFADITIELQDGVCTPLVNCPTTTTDADGYYSFGNNADGTYTVVVDPAGTGIPAGYSLTYDPDETNPCSTCDGAGSVTISGGSIDLTIDFGYQDTPSPLVTIDKDTSTPSVVPGGTATYTIVVRNSGAATAGATTISETLPGNGDPACTAPGCFTFATNDSVVAVLANRTSTTNPTAGTSAISWGTWDILAGGSVTITFTVNIDSGTPYATYDNTISSSYDSTGGSTPDTTINDDGTASQDADTPAGLDPEDDEDVTVEPLPVLSVNKVSSAGGTVNPGQTITYTMTVSNAGPGNANNVVVSDPLPNGTSYVASSTTVTAPQRYADDFEDSTYSGSIGSLDWSGQAWTETGDDGLPGSGAISIVTDLGDQSVSMTGAGDDLSRQVDLTGGYTTMQLSFDYRRNSFEPADSVTIRAWNSSTSVFDTLGTISGGGTDAAYVASAAYPLTSNHTSISFLTGALGGNDAFYLDNVQVLLTGTFAGNAPTGLVTAADNYDLWPGDTMTVTFQATVDNPAPLGLTTIDNTVFVTSDEITTPLTSSTSDTITGAGTASIGDTVFKDDGSGGGTADDGIQNGTEPGLANIAVTLYTDPNGDGDPSDGVEVDRLLTDSNGNYTFTGLTAGNYVVDVDESTLPPSYALTSGNEPMAVTIAAAENYIDADFGYNYVLVALPVTLASFTATGDAYRLAFEWSTETETGNVGFFIYALIEDVWQQLNPELIPSSVIDSVEPQHYSYEAYGVDSDTFLIADVDVRGKLRWHGPFALGDTSGAEALVVEPIPWGRIGTEHEDKERGRHGGWRHQELPEVRFEVATDGLYRVTYEQLLDTGIDLGGVPLAYFALLCRNQPVPIEIEGNGIFGPGSAIIFAGEALDTLYTDTNLYTLRVDHASALRVGRDNSPPPRWATPVTTYQETVRVEGNHFYSAVAPSGDPWYDQRLTAYGGPAATSGELLVSDYVVDGGPATLTVETWGMTVWPENPDHHLVVGLNQTTVADDLFDGQVMHTVYAELPPGLLQEGPNTVELSVPYDLGVAWDIVAVEAYGVTYPRSLRARDDQLTFTAPAADVLQVSGFSSSEIVVYRQEGDAIEQVSKTELGGATGDFSVSFAGSDETATYLVAAIDGFLTPGIVPAPPQEDIFSSEADYLIISHPDFIDGLEPLVQARQDQGLTVKIVDVEHIYTAFSGGVVDPEAIRSYVAGAAETRYLLLVGGDTYDYFDYTGLSSVSFIPSLYLVSGEYVQFAPADPIYGDTDGDGVPDVAVGRLPVRTSDELDSIIGKILDYQDKSYGHTVLSASDAYDWAERISFMEASRLLLDALDPSWQVIDADIDTHGLAQARQVLIDALNQGVALAQFFGHSGPTMWSFQRLFTAADAAQLDNPGRPAVIVQWGCWNTYYVVPSHNTLGHNLMLSGDRGAAAVMGAATLTETASDVALGQYLLPKVVMPGMTIGQALVEAKQELAAEHPGMIDVIVGWTILGDPALIVEE
jgi:uncharacterized repeat protein (TIGR01451 family)